MTESMRFRDEPVLREQLALVHRNYYAGWLAWLLTTMLASYVVYTLTDNDSVFLWLLAAILTVVAITFRHWKRDRTLQPRREASIQVLVMFVGGFIWALLPLLYFDADNATLVMTITVLTAGVTAGALPMQSPCLPLYLTFSNTILVTLLVAFFLLSGPAYTTLGVATLLYMLMLGYCSWNLENTFKESIALRFHNLGLIEQLQDAILEAKEANRAKSVFLASASHDLRQPLHAMGLFIETLKNSSLNVHQKTLLAYINDASDATREMLNTLLDFSKIDAGIIQPEPVSFRLQTLFDKLERELAISADDKGLIYRTRETSAVVYADMHLVELILRNLIINAIRYTEHGGLLLACRKQHGCAMVEVWDTGIGIPLAEQKNIFREFHQLDNPERDRMKGFGLGLAIVERLANSMGTRVTVRSRAGAGSVFRLYLPLSDAQVLADLPMEKPLPRFDDRCILIIDDDRHILVAMKELLTTWGCECLLAESAQEAIELLAASGKTPDALITDYRLREQQTGRRAILALREYLGSQLPAIIITGDTAPNRIREAMDSDALLLHKPVSASSLQRALRDLLR